ncbi:EAL domain-containing protein, partial [Salmonella enterica subsp. enterica serovar Typhimurium]|nr:EAL domain-containing protein [Salmonella enterica subsp. enterica serovar Enteritidis]EGX0730432.1 EAL domain-containing protein [Salmonella enterica subsp. enterica serovar Newport]EJA8599234.1 EAL domain-containing protein [Salmonella enterica]HBI4936263.1 EAL domain-containing protein [Salmonella enterica subsp. enterica serovar Pullorum]HBN2424758.1 EAL domain-containing protein [Salmonella enterica subsp. enterica serovar Typhimurium]
VIAEGIETPAQAARLRDAGGDYLQGWHCGAPMPFGLFHFRLTQKSQPAFG